MRTKSYYEILGISQSASVADIRLAYRKAISKVHPDLNPDGAGTERRSRELNAALETLTDEDKRKKYDAKLKRFQQDSTREDAEEEFEEAPSKEPPAPDVDDNGNADNPFSEPEESAASQYRYSMYQDSTVEEPFDDSDRASSFKFKRKQRRSGKRSRRKRSPFFLRMVVNLLGIAGGALGGIAMAIVILWIGLGLDPLGIMARVPGEPQEKLGKPEPKEPNPEQSDENQESPNGDKPLLKDDERKSPPTEPEKPVPDRAVEASIANAELKARQTLDRYEQAGNSSTLEAAQSALVELEQLDPNSQELSSLRDRLQSITFGVAMERAESLVVAYEETPAEDGLSDAISAVNEVEALAPNENQSRFNALHDRINDALLQHAEFSVTRFEMKRSELNLQAAQKVRRWIETRLQDDSVISNFNDRLTTALVIRLVEIPPTQARAEFGLLEEIGAGEALRSSAKRFVLRRLSLQFDDSLGKGNLESAGEDFIAITNLSKEAANQISKEWLGIPPDDYLKIPTSALLILPPQVLAEFPLAVLSEFPPSVLERLPTDRLGHLRPSVLSTVPSSALSKLPSTILAKLPPTILSKLPPTNLEKLPPVVNSIGMPLKMIPAGTFTMGEGDDAHPVTLTKPFRIGVHEVTQEQYERVMGSNPSRFKGPQNPVERVSWNDAVKFCEKLSALPGEKAAGRVYRLPTEAEWEYACRAGTTTKYSFGDDEGALGDYAWHRANSGGKTHRVGAKRRNPWGLYDMHGNVWEWCQDWHGDYPKGAVTDPTGPNSGSSRVARGGSWNSSAGDCRSSVNATARGSGFRVTCVPSGQSTVESNSIPDEVLPTPTVPKWVQDLFVGEWRINYGGGSHYTGLKLTPEGTWQARDNKFNDPDAGLLGGSWSVQGDKVILTRTFGNAVGGVEALTLDGGRIFARFYSRGDFPDRSINSGAVVRVTSESPPATVEQKAAANALNMPVDSTNSIGMQLKVIPAGTFMTGKGENVYQVKLTKPFMLGVHEVTQEQYERVMGANPSSFKGLQNPVENANWHRAVEFCRKLSELPEEKVAGRTYRLPTEAEWEYACRAGTRTKYHFGDNESRLGEFGWYEDNSGDRTHPVGKKAPNPWGFHDMTGNVWEWCQDWHGANPRVSVVDPKGPSSGSLRVLRGGSWVVNAQSCRSNYRLRGNPSFRRNHIGFRVACDTAAPPQPGDDSRAASARQR